VTRLPIKTIHLNKSPVVIGHLKTLSAARASQLGLDLELALRHAGFLAQHGAWPKAFWNSVYARPTPEHAPDVDEDLYGGFVGNADRRTLNRLRSLTPEALAVQRVGFEDRRLEELLFRYRARNFPESLNGPEHARWARHCEQRLHEGVGDGLTLSEFFGRIDRLSQTADEQGRAVLAALRDYAQQIALPRP
jgi:exodeoxyribonuclease-1